MGYCRWPGGLRDNECLSGNENLGLGPEMLNVEGRKGAGDKMVIRKF